MTPFRFGELLASAVSALAPLLGIAFLVFCGWLYYLMISALRNVKLIRLELTRLNDNLEGRLRNSRTGTLGL